MQKTVLLIAFYFFTIVAFAQQKNFVYIESENGQPFYVKLNDKVHSSSQGGYIVLSELAENNYDIRIGFPKNSFLEQRFAIVLNKKDQGFQLKNFGEKGWGLFNLQTLAITMNSNIQPTDDNQVKKTDGFSVLLSKVVNDPSILVNTPKPAPEKVEAKPVVTEVVKEEVKTVIPEMAKEEVKVPAAVNIQKLFDRRFEKVYEASYLDKSNGVNDTINISYPINEDITAKVDTIIKTKKSDTIKTATIIIKEAQAAKPVNSDCKLFAEDQDVDKLRVKLMNEKTIDERLVVARKHFKIKCFTVKQIKALTELFASDEDKYRLFDTAYPFISDTENFSSLEENLKEEYYKNRFKAMIRK
jgi:hypothetical protein